MSLSTLYTYKDYLKGAIERIYTIHSAGSCFLDSFGSMLEISQPGTIFLFKLLVDDLQSLHNEYLRYLKDGSEKVGADSDEQQYYQTHLEQTISKIEETYNAANCLSESLENMLSVCDDGTTHLVRLVTDHLWSLHKETTERLKYNPNKIQRIAVLCKQGGAEEIP